MIWLLYIFSHCTMGLSIPLRISKITKNKILLNFDWNHLKLFGTGEKLPKDSGNFFRQIFVKNVILMDEKHEWHDWENQTFAQGPIRPCFSKDTKTTLISVTPFVVKISPNYFHSLKSQNHITFNSSQRTITFCTAFPKKRLHEPTHLFIINYILADHDFFVELRK